MAAEETIYAEVLSAIDAGDRARARDLLTRLLKINQENPQYWLWMSAVVDSSKERVYCLKEVLRRDPSNEAARRGLIFSGAAPKEAISAPAPLIRRNWQAAMQSESGGLNKGRAMGKTALTAGGAVLLVALVLLGIFGARFFSAGRDTAERLPTVAAVVVAATPSQTATAPPADSSGPQPLWMQLKATYTATPLAVNTPHPRTEAYRLAMRAYEHGDWAAALGYFEQVATAEPDAIDMLYYLGEVNRLDGNAAAALQAFENTLARDAEYAPAHLGLARALLMQEKPAPAKARTALEKAIELDPALVDAYTELANLLLAQGDAAAAQEVLEAAPPAALDNPFFLLARARAALELDDPQAAADDARRVTALDITLLDAYRLQGAALQAAGDGKDSLQPLLTYTTYAPDDAQALAWLGKAYLADGSAADALQAFDRALKIDDTQGDIYLERGLLYLQQEDGERALADLETAYKLLPRNFAAALGLGRAQLLLGYNGKAYLQFNVTQGLAKSDAEKAQLYYYRALSLERLEKQDAGVIAAAIKDWKALLALPAESFDPAWVKEAEQHLAALYTPTVTPRPATATPTPVPSKTSTPTRTPTKTATRKP